MHTYIYGRVVDPGARLSRGSSCFRIRILRYSTILVKSPYPRLSIYTHTHIHTYSIYVENPIVVSNRHGRPRPSLISC